VTGQVENGHSRLDRAYLLFLILPVPDLDEFRKRTLTSIVPGIGPSIAASEESSESSDTEEEVES
ncbi:hypothetical protein, partial [Halorubrum sp. Atlit-26R]|uniref:hypothetical protein n=1 Tax=Halorubrum sp. Atlit-26R TaxID=2282128 RepID=UPI001F42DBA6